MTKELNKYIELKNSQYIRVFSKKRQSYTPRSHIIMLYNIVYLKIYQYKLRIVLTIKRQIIHNQEDIFFFFFTFFL